MKLVTFITIVMLSLFSAGKADAGLILGDPENHGSSTPYPFGSGNFEFTQGPIYQSVYSSNLFTGSNTSIEIQTLRFYVDPAGNNTNNDLGENTFNIFLSTLGLNTSRSNDPSQNKGTDSVLVFSGFLPSLTSLFDDFVLDIDLTQFFNYSTSLGDLVLTVENTGKNEPADNAESAYFLGAKDNNFWNYRDVLDVGADTLSSQINDGSGIIVGLNQFTSSNAQNVSEPSVFGLLIIFIASMTLRSLRKR